MLHQSSRLMQLVDAAMAGQQSIGSLGPAVTDARFELLSLVDATRQSIEAWKPAASALCSWELKRVGMHAEAALTCLDNLTDMAGLPAWRAAFDTAIQGCRRWASRSQTEACTAAGPTGLPLVNMALRARERGSAELLAPAMAAVLEQCETLLCIDSLGDERAPLERLSQVVARPLEPLALDAAELLAAAQAVEQARIAAGRLTPWPTLNRALTAAHGVLQGKVPRATFDACVPLVAGEMKVVQQKVCASDSAAALQAVLADIREEFERLEEWLAALEAGVRDGDAAGVGVAGRRLGWVLSDLADHKARLEVLEVETLAGDPGSQRVMTANVQKVVLAAQAFAAGRGSVDEVSETIVELHNAIEEAVLQAESRPQGLDMDLFKAGIHSLQQALSQWSLLLGGSHDQLDAGLEHAYTGIKHILDSQRP